MSVTRIKTWALLGLLLPLTALANEPEPLETFFRHAEFDAMVISPNGNYLAATAPHEDRTGVVILDISDFPNVRARSSFALGRGENAVSLTWVSEDRLVFSSTLQVGSLAQPVMTGRIFVTDVEGRRQMQLYGPREGSTIGRQAQILDPLRDDDRRILIADWASDRERPIAWLLDLNRYQRTSRVTSSPLLRGGLGADQDARVRFAYGFDDDNRQLFAWRPDEDSEWQTFDNPFDGQIQFAGFNDDGSQVYVLSRDQQHMGVHAIELETGRIHPLLEDPGVEALTAIWNVARSKVVGAVFNTGIPEYRWIDEQADIARVTRSLENALGSYRISGLSVSDDGSRAVLRLFSDVEPGVFMLLDIESMALHEIAPTREWVPVERMARTQPFEMTARDGLTLHGLMTMPPGVESPESLPMVVEVHGGPYGPFDRWEWDPWVQAMASRGYLVLQVNFRGSGGYGHDFERDAYQQWGAEMQDDLTDATHWAIGQGYADPDRICISGASYGGYAAMMGVIREPELYQCAFAFVGVYDLELMKRTGDIPETEWGRRFLDRILGTDVATLRERSPVHHVSQIEADLFIAHGAEDHRAHFDHYHALIASLEKANIPHQKLWVEGEGHGFYKPENNIRLYGKALDFFARNIGPKAAIAQQDEELISGSE